MKKKSKSTSDSNPQTQIVHRISLDFDIEEAMEMGLFNPEEDEVPEPIKFLSICKKIGPACIMCNIREECFSQCNILYGG